MTNKQLHAWARKVRDVASKELESRFGDWDPRTFTDRIKYEQYHSLLNTAFGAVGVLENFPLTTTSDKTKGDSHVG